MSSGDRLALVEQALRQGRAADAVQALELAIRDGANPAPILFGQVGALMLNAGDPVSAERWARQGLAGARDQPDLLLLLGAALRRQRRLDEALAVLQACLRQRPGHAAILVNLADVHIDRGEGAGAETLLDALLAARPDDPALRHKLGHALRLQGRLDDAAAAFDASLAARPNSFEAWRDRAYLASERQRHDEAIAIVARAGAALPADPRLTEAHAEILRRAGRIAEARALLEAAIEADDQAAFAHRLLGALLESADPAAARAHLRKAAGLAPTDPRPALALIRDLVRMRESPADLDEAHAIALRLTGAAAAADGAFTLGQVLARTADLDRVETLGDFAGLGRRWALSGQHAALLEHMARVRSPADRLALVEHHRLWGASVTRRVAQDPIRPSPRGPRDKLRVGFLSSDLRDHAVGYFALPLFQHYDRERLELFVYSSAPTPGNGAPSDPTQQLIAASIQAYRQFPGLPDKAAAQVIADDRLDVLVDLGAATQFNRAQLAAYRPAPVQVSWMGYPHSTGLAEIGHIVLDPHLVPTSPGLLLEQPLLMPASWIALGERAFPPDRPATPEPPALTKGYVTFGTANNPVKYTRACLDAWARVLAAVPKSRFLIVRPEAGSKVFQANIAAAFAVHGVAAERLDFAPVRGAHLPWYDRMDVSLDTFPQTGGTTTCESLWMGVPVVSLRGEAVFERLSHSILTNAGLADLSVDTIERYVAKAVDLASDLPRLTDLRRTLRARLAVRPLGQTSQFTRDFFALLESAV